MGKVTGPTMLARTLLCVALLSAAALSADPVDQVVPETDASAQDQSDDLTSDGSPHNIATPAACTTSSCGAGQNGEKQFCSTECFTRFSEPECPKDGSVGAFCQPCTYCQSGSTSYAISGSCTPECA